MIIRRLNRTKDPSPLEGKREKPTSASAPRLVVGFSFRLIRTSSEWNSGLKKLSSSTGEWRDRPSPSPPAGGEEALPPFQSPLPKNKLDVMRPFSRGDYFLPRSHFLVLFYFSGRMAMSSIPFPVPRLREYFLSVALFQCSCAPRLARGFSAPGWFGS